MNKNMTVTVFDGNGKQLGMTYPKRAKGLIKHGRARLSGENQIQLCFCPPGTKPEDNMENININEQKRQNDNSFIIFNARDWDFVQDPTKQQIGSRLLVTNYNDEITEAFTLGDWDHNWTEISCVKELEKNTKCTFSFWLNGGENDRYDEICRFMFFSYDNPNDEIEVSAANNNKSVFNLNRNYIRYKAHCRGWYLYELPIMTDDKKYTEMRFAAMNAPCTIISAKPDEDLTQLELTKPDGRIPQRSNLAFADGYPHNNTWSYLVFDKNEGAMPPPPPKPHGKPPMHHGKPHRCDSRKNPHSFNVNGVDIVTSGNGVRVKTNKNGRGFCFFTDGDFDYAGDFPDTEEVFDDSGDEADETDNNADTIEDEYINCDESSNLKQKVNSALKCAAEEIRNAAEKVRNEKISGNICNFVSETLNSVSETLDDIDMS